MPADRDLIAEGREMLERVAPGPSMTADPWTAYGWVRDNLPALLDALEAGQRPPLGYVVIAKRLTRTIIPRYTTAGGIWDEREPVDSHRAHCEDSAVADLDRFGSEVEYIVAEVREVRQ